jgi:hypothetical protein
VYFSTDVSQEKMHQMMGILMESTEVAEELMSLKGGRSWILSIRAGHEGHQKTQKTQLDVIDDSR